MNTKTFKNYGSKYTALIVAIVLFAIPFAGHAQDASNSDYADCMTANNNDMSICNTLLTTDTSSNTQTSGIPGGVSGGSPSQPASVAGSPQQGTAPASTNTSGSAGKVSIPSFVTPSAPKTTSNTSNTSNNTSVVTLKNPLQANSISDIIFSFMQIVTYLAVIFGVIMLMWVGLQMVLAQGKPEEIKRRSTELLWVVVGIGVIIGARILVSAVINTLSSTGTVNNQIIQNAQNAVNSTQNSVNGTHTTNGL